MHHKDGLRIPSMINSVTVGFSKYNRFRSRKRTRIEKAMWNSLGGLLGSEHHYYMANGALMGVTDLSREKELEFAITHILACARALRACMGFMEDAFRIKANPKVKTPKVRGLAGSNL